MKTGRIVKLISEMQFGYIESEYGNIFFHCSDMRDGNFSELEPGQVVSYELQVQEGQRDFNEGPCALWVELLPHDSLTPCYQSYEQFNRLCPK